MDKFYKINSSLNVSLAISHGFIQNDNLTEEYKILQKKYYLLLEAFLCQNLHLKEIETKLDASNRFFNRRQDLIANLENQNIQLSYFFIRSNLNIENLSEDELNVLNQSKDLKHLYLLVKKTFLKVIKVNFLYGQKIEESRILYDGTSESYLKSNNSLVLGFVDDLTSEKIPDDEWDTFSLQRDELKTKVFSDIKNEALVKIGCNIEFIEYSLSLLKKIKQEDTQDKSL